MNKVVLYSKTNCGPCNQVKLWLQSNNIEYELATIQDAIEDGYRGVPVVTYKGHTAVGFDIKNLLKIKESYGAV